MSKQIKQRSYIILRNLFEGPTAMLSLGMLVYLMLWFAPFIVYDIQHGIDPQVWAILRWRPDVWTAGVIIPLAIVQTFLNPSMYYRGIGRVLGATALSAFICYTAIAPGYVIVTTTGFLPEYLPGAVTVMLMSFIVVARELRDR